MTRDDIIRMAQEAGATFDHMTWVERDLQPVFERFHAIAVAAEREECAKLCENIFQTTPIYTTYAQAAQDCAEAIRARGER